MAATCLAWISGAKGGPEDGGSYSPQIGFKGIREPPALEGDAY